MTDAAALGKFFEFYTPRRERLIADRGIDLPTVTIVGDLAEAIELSFSRAATVGHTS